MATTIYAAGFGGTYLDVVIATDGGGVSDPSAYSVNMNGYATFHNLRHGEHQQGGSASTCYIKGNQEATTNALRRKYHGRVVWVDRIDHWEEGLIRKGFICGHYLVRYNGDVTLS